MTDSIYRKLTPPLIAAMIICGAIFTLWPSVDLWVSSLFWRPKGGFWIDKIPLFELLRDILWQGMVVVFFASLIAIPVTILWRPIFGITARVWSFVALMFLLGPGVLVNALLKENWGRARPYEVTQFGGPDRFTTPFQYSEECSQNCSFVSGEGSGAATLAISVVALTWHMKNRVLARWIVGITCAIAAFGLAMRIIKGRHFLSDTVFAVLLMAALALLLGRLFWPEAKMPKLRRGRS